MARTKPGPTPKTDLIIPCTLTSLNLSEDVIILDNRRTHTRIPLANTASNWVTRLGDISRKTPQKKTDLVPRLGTIDPTTEDPDEIVQLFDEWRLHQQTLIKVEKLSRKSYPREYKL